MKDGRYCLRLDTDLVQWLRRYCKQRRMTLSSLIRQLLEQLRRVEEEQKDSDAEQI